MEAAATSPSPWILILIGTFAALVTLGGGFTLLSRRRGGDGAEHGWNTALKRAHGQGDLLPMLAFLSTVEGEEQATRTNQAIRSLWDHWERETATRLIREVAELQDAKIVQYWIQRVLEVEPELAELHFGPVFLEERFRPEVARACGTRGCCG